MRKVKTVLILVGSWFMYFLSHFFPRDERLWVFVGWYKSKERETFADNSKYLFLHIANERKDIRAIWIARDKKMSEILRKEGYESYDVHSLKGIYYSLRAGYTIIDAIMKLNTWRLSGRSKIIQLWHADGIKTLELSSTWSLKKLEKIFSSPGLFRRAHFFIASSPFIATHFTAPSFDVPLEEVHITGLPRYDIFFSSIRGAQIDINIDLKQKLEKARAKNPEKIILYAPTFRRSKAAGVQLGHIDLSKLNAFALERNYVIFLSLHPKFSASAWLPEGEFSNIFFMNADYDFYPLLSQFDLLVTDYSSSCLEFLLLDKPSIFYVYDFEKYKKDPGIPEEFWGLVPGPRVRTFEQLLQALEAPDTLAAEREQVRNILFTFSKGESSRAVAEAVLKETRDSQKLSSSTQSQTQSADTF